MAIGINNTGGAAPASSAPSWQHTVGSAADRALIVVVSGWAAGTANVCSAVSYGGTALTKAADSGRGPGGDYAQIWYLVNPAVGTATIATTINTTGWAATGGNSLDLTGVDQAAPTGAGATATGTSTTPSINALSASGDLVVDGIGWDQGTAATATVGANQTAIGNRSGGGEGSAASRESATGTSTTMSWSLSASASWAIAAIAVKAAGGTSPIAGALAATLDGVSLASAGTVAGPAPIAGDLAATLDGVTLSATSVVAGPGPITGALGATLDSLSISAAGTVAGPIAGDLAATLDAVTIPPIAGDLAAALDGVTLSAAGLSAAPGAIAGSLSATLAGVTLSAAGAVSSPTPIAGSLSTTLAGVTLSAAGVVSSGLPAGLPPTRGQIVADVTLPTFDVEVWTGAAWLSVKEHVTAASASIDAQGGASGAAAMGPNVTPEATVELAAAGWLQASDRTPVRISFGFGTSATVVRFGGIVTGRSRGPRYGRWELRGWDAHIEGQEVRSLLYRRRPIATQTTISSVEDLSLSTNRTGLINIALWMCGGRPWEQRLSYPSALFFYRCTTALIGPEYTWTPGDSPWEVIRRLCRAAGGQIYQDGEGTICYVDPITLATGTPLFTFTDEALSQEQRAAQGKAGYEDIQLEIDSLASITGASCAFVSRRVQGEQTIYEDATPRQIAAGAVLTLNCDTQLPLYSLGAATCDAVVIRTATQATTSQVAVAATLGSAQRVTVTITNTLAEPVMVDALRIAGRPVSAGEEGSASYSTGTGRVVSIEDSAYVQSERHAAQLCRMVYEAEANGGQIYILSGCSYDPDRFVGEVIGLTSSELGVAALRCRIVRIEADGIWMSVTLAPLGSLPTRDSVHLIGAVSGTKELAY